ncbi:MAG TPA: hypothetical protein VGB63_13370 [Pedobacter sp.]|jgi:hypothetical protein
MKPQFNPHVFLIFLCVLIFSSCKRSDASIESTTTWKLVNGADTISLKPSLSFLELNRGKELINGFILPKAASGLYTYSVFSDSIKLHNMISSDSRTYNYYFKVANGKLTIGNFYKKYNGLGDILVFKKLN